RLLMSPGAGGPEPAGRALTTGKFQDAAPAFSADGKRLALLSLRSFETVYDDMVFDLGFVNAERPFLLPLERTTPDPFGPHPDGWGAAAEEDAKDGGGGKDAAGTGEGSGSAAATHVGGAAHAASEQPATSHSAAGADEAQRPPATRIDLDSVESRLVPFPVVSGYYSHLTAVSGGFVWLRHPQQGVLGSARAGVKDDAPKPTLEHWSLADRKLTVLAEGVTDLSASGDGETLVITQGEQRVQVPAARKVEDEDPAR